MLDETELREGLGRMIRIEPGDVPQSLVDSLINEPSLEAAYTAALNATEVANTREVITYFQVFLGRLPAPEGLTFWTGMANGDDVSDPSDDASLSGLKQAFVASPEFTDRFAEFTSYEGIVTQLFNDVLGREPLLDGLEFWSDRGRAIEADLIEAGVSASAARTQATAELALAFVEANETEERFDAGIDAVLVSAALNGDDVFDVENDIFAGGQFSAAVEQTDENRFILALNTVEGADPSDIAFAGVSADPDEIDTLRLTGDASVRIDLTDPRSQLEGIDIDGSRDGVLDAGEVNDGITFDEQDQAFRDAVELGFFDIFDAHPRDAALLNPGATDQGYTGNLYFDGTGFDGSGTFLSGNIVLGGYGADTIFTGNGNDFISTGGLNDTIKAGRNADFIYQELSRLDDAFSGDDGEIDGGVTFDDDPAADSDWLLLEASDDEEPVEVALAGVTEDGGFISTRLGNDSANIRNVENVNASGNFYKFFDQSVTAVTTSALVGFGDTFNADTAAAAANGFRFFVEGDQQVFVSRADIDGFNDGAGVQSVDDLRALTQASFDAVFGAGEFLVVTADDTEVPLPPGITLTSEGPVDATGPVVFVTSLGDLTFSADPSLLTTQDELARGVRFVDPETTQIVSDLFFGDNRDFSPEEVEYRVPGLSPGVTAQMIIRGSDPSDDIEDPTASTIDEDGGNIIIAGYDNDAVYGLGGNDLLFGGDMEFLLTHRHNPNLFNTNTDTVSVNGADGIADDGRDTLVGGTGNDNLVWEADAGAYYGDDAPGGAQTPGLDALWVTTFSVGRLVGPESAGGVARSTDGSTDEFLGVDGLGAVAAQDLTGTGEADDEDNAVDALTTDGVLRFDLGMGAGQDFQGNGDDVFRGDLQGADRLGTADQTNYASGFEFTRITDVEDFNASGLGGIDYLAAGIGDPDGTDLTFENQQNYRGTNSDLDIRGIDLANPGEIVGNAPAFGYTNDDAGSDASFATSLNGATFNGWQQIGDTGSPVSLADLVYATSGEVELQPVGGRVSADNRLFASFGDDTLEGRGGDDLLEGREGDDVFIQAISDSVPGGGDGVDIIARRQDFDQNGILDTTVDGETIVGRDFRPGEIVIDTVPTPRFQIQPIGGEDDTFDIPNGTDNWNTFISLTFNLSDGSSETVTVGPGLQTATQVAAALQNAGNLPSGLFFTPEEAVDDPDTSDDPDSDPGFLDAVVVTFNPLLNTDGLTLVGEPVAEFTSPENAGFGILALEPGVVPVVSGEREDDEIVFRSYQNRNDDESVPDRQTSLGLEAYAEDLVVGVQDGTTKLVEGQEYRIFIEDLKENDTVSVRFNGTTYQRTVDFNVGTGDNSETTAGFLQAFAAQINAAIAADPHMRDGNIFVEFVPNADDPTTAFREDLDSGILVVRERVAAGDNAEHVFIQFPEVTVQNASGGDRGNWSVKETSDSSTVIFEYDYRDPQTDGLNRGVGTYEQRGDLLDDRFITFEDTTGINRAILQDAENGGTEAAPTTLRGLDITVFDQPGAPDFRGDNDSFEDGIEVILQDRIDDDPERSLDNDVDDLQAFIPQDDGTEVIGNSAGNGQPVFGPWSGLNGDDNLRGSAGVEIIDGNTGDDRITASTNGDTDDYVELYDGGVDVVINTATGQVVENDALVAGLDQTPGAGEIKLNFVDTLIIEEGQGDSAEMTEKAGFTNGALFTVTVTDVAEDFSIDGRLGVDEDADGDFEHTATIANMEVIRTLSDTKNDTVSFAGLNLNTGDADNPDFSNTGSVFFDAWTGAVAYRVAGADDALFTQDDRVLQAGQLLGFENVTGTAAGDTFQGRGVQEWSGADGFDRYVYVNLGNDGTGLPADTGDAGADTRTVDPSDDENTVTISTSGLDIIDFDTGEDVIDASGIPGVIVNITQGSFNRGAGTFTFGDDDNDNEAIVQLIDANGNVGHIVVLNAFNIEEKPDLNAGNVLGADTPIAVPDTATTDEGTPVTIDVLANDSDPNGDPISIVALGTEGTDGTVSDNGDGTVTYDPNGAFDDLEDDETATDSFTYTIEDPAGNAATATVTVTIEGVSTPPIPTIPVDSAGEITGATAGVTDFFVASIDFSNGQPALNPDFDGEAELVGFDPAEDFLIFENIGTADVTEADFFADPLNVGDDVFEGVTENTFGPSVTFIYGVGAGQTEGASILIEGVGELDADGDEALDFVLIDPTDQELADLFV